MNGREILIHYFNNEELEMIFENNTKYLKEFIENKNEKDTNPYSLNNILWQFLPDRNYSLDKTKFSSKDLFLQTTCQMNNIKWKFNETTNGTKLHFNYQSNDEKYNYGIIFSPNNRSPKDEKYILFVSQIENDNELKKFNNLLIRTTKEKYYDTDFHDMLIEDTSFSLIGKSEVFILPEQDFLIYLLYNIFYFEIN